MVTKTITIAEDSYHLLKQNKLKDESFSDVIRRHFKPNKRGLEDFFGILSKEEGTKMLTDLKKIRKFNRDKVMKRIQ